MDVLFVLLIGTFFLALLGHGIWVLMAAIGRAIFGGGDSHSASPPGEPATKRRHECPICTADFPTPRASCEVCGWPFRKPGEPDRRRLALEALARLAARFRRTGWLDVKSYELVDRALAESQSATEPAPETSLAPEPLPVAPLPLEPAPLEPKPLEAEPPAPEPPPAEVVAPLPLPLPVHEAEPEPDREVAPHRPFAKILASFLEEKNIRWGELIGGLLIICSSIALVLSFWNDISQRPLVKFGLFNGVTAALFGVGLYVQRRWRLPTTTHGILLIAVLLVPLNFLAIAAFTLDSAPTKASPILGELLSIALFAGLTFAAGRILVGPAAWHVAVGVVGASALELVVRRFADSTSSTETLLALGLPAVLCFALPTVYWARRLDRDTASATFGESETNRLFNITGATFFAALLPLAILLAKTGHVAQTLTRIAPLVSLLGAPLVAVGLVLWRRLTTPELMKERVAGTTIAVAGAMAMLAAVALGWPTPAGMLPTALINTLVFVWIGLRCGIPAAHLPAALCLAAAYLLGFHVALGNIAWHGADPRTTLASLLSAGSGTALVAPAVLFALAAIFFGRRSTADTDRRDTERRETAAWYGAAAGLVAVVSIGLITCYAFRFKDEVGATFVYALYAVGAIVAAMRIGEPALGYIGSTLLGFAIMQGLFRYGGDGTPAEGWSVAMLLHGTISLLAMRLIVAFGNRSKVEQSLDTKPYDGAATPLFTGAVITSVLALPTLAYLAYIGQTQQAAIFWTWLTLIWGVVAWWLVSSRSFDWFQFAGFMAVLQWSHLVLQRRSWYDEIAANLGIFDPRALAAYGLGATALCGAWIIARLVLRRSLPADGSSAQATSAPRTLLNDAARFVHVSPHTVDRVVLGFMVALIALLAIGAIVPGTQQELLPRHDHLGTIFAEPTDPILFGLNFRTVLPPYGHFHGPPVWLLWGAVGAVVVLGMWERFAWGRLVGLVLLTTAASMFVAARWENVSSTASALRWTSVLAFTLLSLPLWFRGPIVGVIDRLGWPGWTERPTNLARQWFGWSLGLTLLPVLAMTLVAIVAAMSVAKSGAAVEDAWWGSFAFAIGALAVSGILTTAHRSSATSTSGRSWSLLGARLAGLAGVAPLAAVILYAIAAAFDASPIVGPMPTSEFARMGSVASYTTPIWILAAALVLHAWLGASALLAFSASLLLNLGATIAYLLIEARTGLKFDAALWLRLGQLNAAVSGAFAIGWTALILLRRKLKHGDERLSSWVTTQAALGAALFTPAVLGPLGYYFLDLYDPARVPLAAADVWAWGSFAVALIAALLWFRVVREPISIATWSLSALAIVSLDTLSRIPRPTPPQGTGELVTLDRLVAGWLIIAFGLAAVGFKAERRGWAFGPARSVIRWSTFIGFAAFVAAQHGLAVIVGRSMFNSGPLASHGFLQSVAFLVAVLCAGLAGWGASRWRLYAAALFATYGAIVVWCDTLGARWYPGTHDSATVVLFVLLIAWSLPTPLWLVIERRFIIPRSARRAGDVSPPVSSERMEQRRRSRLPILSQTTGVTSLILMTLAVATGLLRDLAQEPHAMHPWLYGAAITSVLIAVASSLWDPTARRAVAMLYVAGLVAIGAALDISFAVNRLDTRMLFWLGTMFASAYALATSYLWSIRAGLKTIAAKLGMPAAATDETAAEQGGDAAQRGSESAAGWLVAANYLLAVLVVVAAYRVILVYDAAALRMSAAHAVFGAAAAVALLAQGARRSSLQLRALEFGWIGAIAAGWAVIQPGETWEFLNRATLAVAATALVIAVYGLGFAKLLQQENDWTAAAVRLVPRLIVVAGLGLALILCGEVYEYVEFGAVAIGPTAIGAVLAALVGLAAAAITAAVVPGRDPLGMSERERMRYVYGAEIILALAMLHVRLTMSWLFSGFWLRYWPVLVMLLAFVGVGLGEVFRRRNTNVLAEPLEKTGAFLPLLPVVGFWVTKTDVHYSLLLLAVGLLYSTLAVMRKSFGFGILAALAANGGLWYFLAHQEGLGWLQHPQLWLIPPALCVLIAAHLNRHRLKEEQATAYRYGAATTIYVASTADVFLNGVAEAPLLPLWLAALSIAGIFAGIALRVRAFLFLGTAFLLLALMTIIWHAAYDLEQTWIFYVTGIVAGTLIIALFAVFEKKRQEILAVVERLREWEA